MKFKFSILILIVQTAVSLYSVSFDWGGSIQNLSDLSLEESGLEWTQSDGAALWLDLGIHDLFNLKLSGGYNFVYMGGEASHIPVADNLQFYGENDFLAYKAGRFSFRDMNGHLADLLIDGVQLSYKHRLFTISAASGFTGLIFADNSNVLMTSKDFQARIDGALLASPRLMEYGEVAFHVLPGDGTVSAAYLAQQEMRSSLSCLEGEGLLHTMYADLSAKGRIGSSVFYDFYAIGQIGNYFMFADNRILAILAGAAGLNLTVPLNIILDPVISVKLYYSSGDAEWVNSFYGLESLNETKEYIYQYIPLSVRKVGYVFDGGVGNMMYGDVSAGISPFEWLNITARSLTLFRTINGSLLDPAYDPDSASFFIGEEVGLNLDFKIFSDLGVQLKGGLFIPNDDLMTTGLMFKASALVTLKF